MVDHPFQVGGYYANRIGRYEVIKIDDSAGSMVVRYTESGEETELTISTQMRIWDNMSWEQQAEEQSAAEEEARYQKGYGESFAGLKESDFKRSTEGTTWRSRQGLAGRVALLLAAETPYTFVSWAIYRWPVAFMTHRDDYAMAAFEMGARKAKFTVELDEQYAYYGFYIEQNTGPMDHTWDWPRLTTALGSNPQLQTAIAQAENQHGARFIARYSRGDAHFHYSNGVEMGAMSLWDEERSAEKSVEERADLLRTIPDEHWGEIYILGVIPKYEAIQAGLSVADTMAGLMRALLPIYQAAVTTAS
jgi:hypothetical protein